MSISKIFSLRNYVMKQIMKTNKEGIMQIPNKSRVDFGEMIIRENLFRKGIDPKTITNEQQLDNILNTPTVSPKPMPKKSGEVIDVDFGKPIDPEDMADGGVAGLLGERPGYVKGLKVQGSGSISGKNQIQGAPEDITSNKSFINLIANLDIPISEQISLLGDVYYNKFRDKIEKGDEELFIEDPASYINKKIGIGINQGNEGFSGSVKYDVDSGKPEYNILFKKYFAQGGPARQNFAMGRRAFLKLMGGVGAGIGALKTGALKLLGKEPAKQVAKEVVKQSTSTPPPYFFKLVEKIKIMGDDTLATQDKAIAKKYKDYTLEEDFAGNIEIIKKGDDVAEDVYMSYKVDEVPIKGKKSSRKVEEYEEYTARPDEDGKMKDIEPGVPDEVVNEGSVFEDNMTEFGMTKKASGGRVPLAGGGFAFKLAKRYRQSKQYKDFIEKLFVKTSNEIRRGEGAFKNLSVNEKIKLHDDLTKEVTNYQKTGELPESAHQYFGFNPEQQYADSLLQKQLKMTPEEELRQEFPGITDEMVSNILTDTNQQRIAEVKATMKEALKMQEKGMGTDEILQTFEKTPRTKNASGGIARLLGE